MCGWQVKLCDPLVTHESYLSALELHHDKALYKYQLLYYYFASDPSHWADATGRRVGQCGTAFTGKLGPVGLGIGLGFCVLCLAQCMLAFQYRCSDRLP